MKLTYKVNTGTIKTGKHEQSRFNDNDVLNLQELEKDTILLFNALSENKIKNTFKERFTVSQCVEYNSIKRNGVKEIKLDKSIRGCFITYVFEVK